MRLWSVLAVRATCATTARDCVRCLCGGNHGNHCFNHDICFIATPHHCCHGNTATMFVRNGTPALKLRREPSRGKYCREKGAVARGNGAVHAIHFKHRELLEEKCACGLGLGFGLGLGLEVCLRARRAVPCRAQGAGGRVQAVRVCGCRQ